MFALTLVAQATTEPTDMSVEVVNEPCADLGPLCDLLFDWTGNSRLSETVAWVVATPLKIALIVFVALFVNRFARSVIRRFMERLGTVAAGSDEGLISERSQLRAQERASTIGSLLRSASTGLVLSVAAVMILDLLGVSIVPILASAGILTLAVGFGAQSMVEDFLRGIFMLSEDQFGMGDRIDVGLVNGFVERVTLRTTIIKDPNGILWHLPNSQINYVANENQLSNRAVVEIGVSYSTDIRMAMDVLAEAARAAAAEPEWRELATHAPEVRGVQELGEHEVVIRVQVWVEGGAMRQFQRHLRQRLKEGLDAAGIEIPNPNFEGLLQKPEGGVTANRP